MHIRVDGNDKIATGHIMRCIAIADALKSRGEDTTFIIADEYPREIIECHGYNAICLNTAWDDMDAETGKMAELIEKEKIQKLLVDSYYATYSYLESLRKHTAVIYIDDLGGMAYPVDAVINYAGYGKSGYREQYSGTDTKLWMGSMYTPLRSEFFNCRYNFRRNANRILITTGGTDKYNMAFRIADHIVKKRSDVELYIIAGRYNKNVSELLGLQSEYPENIFVFQNADNMAELMQKCDIAISAGGTTLFELCACGLPTVCFGFADNQIGLINMLGEHGIMVNVGDIREKLDKKTENISSESFRLLGNGFLRKAYSQKMSRVTDGKGALRIADKILELYGR